MTLKTFKPIPSSKLVGRMVNGIPKGTKSYIIAKTRELKEEEERDLMQIESCDGSLEDHFLYSRGYEGDGKIYFPRERAETVIMTFELIIQTIEGLTDEFGKRNPKADKLFWSSTNKSITIDQLKELKTYCKKLYYNKQVVLE